MTFKSVVARLQANFLAGLAIVLPVVLSIALLVWLFGTLSGFTDTLLFFLPDRWTHRAHGLGPMFWYWRVVAFVVGIALVCVMGQLARYYFGKKMIELADTLLLRVPLLNKIYSTLKQVNEAFTSNKKTSFKQVVMVEFPQPGQYAVGFLTGEQHEGLAKNIPDKLVSVFIPTTPNPTSGFMVLMPESGVTRLDMSVADGIKFIISLGAISPEGAPGSGEKTAPVAALRPPPAALE